MLKLNKFNNTRTHSELIIESSKHGIVKIKIDTEDVEKVSFCNWHISSGGYIYNRKNNLFLHRIINNTPGGMETDHINHDKWDNRKLNLRNCTHLENMQNSPTIKYGCAGVLKNKKWDNWTSRITVNGIRKYLGSYKTLEEAITARKNAEALYYKKDVA